ncbi:MAG: hypothetical protein MJ016_03510 [Victivallaceae bacterium]|nr:hypothetical protein [Victivallaceae bacterium]
MSEENEKNKEQSGLGCFGILAIGILLAALKWTHALDWSWAIVSIPLGVCLLGVCLQLLIASKLGKTGNEAGGKIERLFWQTFNGNPLLWIGFICCLVRWAGIVDWPWLWVTSPFWIMIPVTMVEMFIAIQTLPQSKR